MIHRQSEAAMRFKEFRNEWNRLTALLPEELDKKYCVLLEETRLPLKTRNTLYKAGVTTLEEVLDFTLDDLLKLRTVGPGIVAIICREIEHNRVKLKKMEKKRRMHDVRKV